MKFTFEHSGQVHTLELQMMGEVLKAVVNGQVHETPFERGQPLILNLNGQPVKVAWAKEGRDTWLHVSGRTYMLRRTASGRAGGQAAGGERSLRAPMPGQVRKVLVQPGDEVTAGAVLLLLEAMKMEVRILASQDAKVALVAVTEGQSVDKEQLLVELEPDNGG